jgi:hypothetical protein
MLPVILFCETIIVPFVLVATAHALIALSLFVQRFLVAMRPTLPKSVNKGTNTFLTPNRRRHFIKRGGSIEQEEARKREPPSIPFPIIHRAKSDSH